MCFRILKLNNIRTQIQPYQMFGAFSRKFSTAKAVPACRLAEPPHLIEKYIVKGVSAQPRQALADSLKQFSFDPSKRKYAIKMRSTIDVDGFQRYAVRARGFLLNGHRVEIVWDQMTPHDTRGLEMRIEAFVTDVRDIGKPLRYPLAKGELANNRVVLTIWPCTPGQAKFRGSIHEKDMQRASQFERPPAFFAPNERQRATKQYMKHHKRQERKEKSKFQDEVKLDSNPPNKET
eukprot:GHVN01001295.1.p2 GENE.GHVN01001295.1~~GHVN01001295.1.p2  ORF type:complete len:234 (+),score=24.28 GHVN01001295.1:1863-2564(+)